MIYTYYQLISESEFLIIYIIIEMESLGNSESQEIESQEVESQEEEQQLGVDAIEEEIVVPSMYECVSSESIESLALSDEEEDQRIKE